MSTIFGNWVLYSVPDDELDEKEFHDQEIGCDNLAIPQIISSANICH